MLSVLQTNSNPVGAEQDTFRSLETELREGLSIYWETASEVLHDSGINLLDPGPDYFSMEGNFFSALFLYSYFRADIPRSQRVLYVSVNQCLRGMVTGCDNLLDDEYKKTLLTDLPENAFRFRSILDIMVSDRVLFALLHRKGLEKKLTPAQVAEATFTSLRVLTRSGAQEASEENGAGGFLNPEEILEKVHHYKTGMLFLSPWGLPDIIEDLDPDKVSQVKNALYHLGMGCQIFDDMVDLSMDIRMNRHNYVASLIRHEKGCQDLNRINRGFPGNGPTQDNPDLLFDFPGVKQRAAKKALDYLEKGMSMLFPQKHLYLADYAIAFIAARIGADRFLSDVERYFGPHEDVLKQGERGTIFNNPAVEISAR